MPSQTIDEKTLNKGQVRKLNALRKSVGAEIADRAFAEWMSTRQVESGDDNAERIAAALWPLIEQGSLRIPRGGYVVKRGRGRIVVEPASS